jgi:hypothetical protein
VREQERGPVVRQSALDPSAAVQVSSYFNKLEERSKSPITGFRKINGRFGVI